MFDYTAVADEHSLLNTPPTFAWYMAGLVFKWLKKNGGVAAMGERNRRQGAQRCMRPSTRRRCTGIRVAGFALLDERDLHPDRSPSWTRSSSSAAAEAGLHGLKGHRVLGGMRASLYNAMPLAGVEALIAFMREFERDTDEGCAWQKT